MEKGDGEVGTEGAEEEQAAIRVTHAPLTFLNGCVMSHELRWQRNESSTGRSKPWGLTLHTASRPLLSLSSTGAPLPLSHSPCPPLIHLLPNQFRPEKGRRDLHRLRVCASGRRSSLSLNDRLMQRFGHLGDLLSSVGYCGGSPPPAIAISPRCAPDAQALPR
jgi:hypothetical protein